MKHINVWREVETHDGRIGSYTMYNGLLTVKTPDGTKTTQLGGSPPKVLARIMLRELAEDQR